MDYFVYLITAVINNRKISYVGYTNNLIKRINLHNSSKGAKFTKGKIWKLVYYKKFKTKSLAMKYEYFLKKNRKIRNMIKLNNL